MQTGIDLGCVQITTNLIHADYARVVLADMDEAERWEALAALGYGYSEIQWHLDHPRQFMPQGFVHAD